MISRSHRFLASLPVIALAPLLAAPRGCHFGDGDVPLGRDGTGGDAGTAGVGSTTSVGGAMTPGAGGTSSVGGAMTPGAGGTSSVGGSSAGGAGTSTGPCIETLSPFDSPRHEITLDDVERLLAPDRRASLVWAVGGSTEITVALFGVSVYYVESKRNPDFNLDIPVSCENHLRAIAIARLWSSDGQIDETVPRLNLNIAIPTNDGPGVAGQRIEASAVVSIDGERFRGTYAPAIPTTQCFLALQFNLGLGFNDFNGELTETIGSSPCGVKDPNGAALGRNAGDWRCAADCGVPPETAIVVEAESCESLGPQLTHAGDEATFERSGDTLTRVERFGCGCATESEFVMAWAPQSPLELRLCDHDGRNSCLASCEQEVSYDLSTAFRTAGANEFRFVD